MGAGGMAKAKSKQVVLRLMSQAGTGYYYTFRTTLKGVREKCAHRHRSRLLHYPCHLHHRLFVSSALGRRHCLVHQRHHYPPPLPPHSLPSLPPPSPSASASTLASSHRLRHHRRLRPRHHRCNCRPRHHRPLPHHRPHRTVPVPSYCTARPHCNPRRSPSSPANAPRPTRRLQLMKHDPVVNKHVLFKEERIKK